MQSSEYAAKLLNIFFIKNTPESLTLNIRNFLIILWT